MIASRASRGAVRLSAGLGALLTLILQGPSAQAASLERRAISGGAIHESGAGYTLSATVGEIGVVGLVQGPGYTLGSGFWQGYGDALAAVAAPHPSTIRFVNGLRQNFPNPFSDGTSIAFTVAEKTPVRLTVYDVTGRRVRTLLNADREPGRYVMHWQGHDEYGSRVASGIYFYRLNIGSWTETRRMVRLR